MNVKLHKIGICMSKLAIYAIVIVQSMIMVMASGSKAQQKLLEEIPIHLHFSAESRPLLEVLSEIEAKGEFTFAYSKRDVRGKTILLEDENWTMESLMKEISVQGHFSIRRVNETISLNPVDKSLLPDINEKIVVQFSVSGTVIDENGESLPGATIQEKGTANGTITDVEGNYSLNVSDENAILIISSVGFLRKEVAINNQRIINVDMTLDVTALDEVVVVGYGTQKKATLTGSVADVSGETLEKNPITNLSNSLSGLLPGVITRSSSGEPGRDDALVLVRGRNTTGNTSPLIVVDGIQGFPGWQRINQRDIESISVLKDAAAAIYGARAANGVILITTKRGVKGKPTINYSFNQGLSQPTRVPQMASSATFAEYINQLYEANGSNPRFTQEEIEKFRNGSDPNYRNTDWYGEVLKNVTPQSRHNVSIRGGAENLKYFFSGSASNQNSIFEDGSLNYKNYSFIGNFDFDINQYISLGLNVNNIYENGNYPTSTTSTTFDRLKQVPFDPVYWADGYPSTGVDLDNPAVMATSIPGTVTDKVNRSTIKGSFKIDVPGVEGLNLNGYYVFADNNGTVKDWELPWQTYSYDAVNDEYIGRYTGILSPQLTESYDNSQRNLLNISLNYEKVIGEHTINTFIAAEQESNKYKSFSAFRKDFLSQSIDELFAGGLADQSTSGVSSENGRKNLFGRVHYEFAGKYLMDFNYRYDGSSAFPEGQRFGFFPGLSVGWRLSEETFLNQFDKLDNLKIRASVGKIGNDAIDPFQFLRSYTVNNLGMPFGTSFELQSGLVAGVEPNPNITWEVATLSNLGFDVSFWSGKLDFQFDAFRQKRENILTQRNLTIPYYTGFSLPVENIGSVENKGFELQVNHRNHKRNGDFSYRIGGNFAFTKNNILSIDEATNVPDWQRREGKILGAELYYEALGIIRTEEDLEELPLYPGSQIGDLYYRDVNGDGIITSLDRVRTNKTNIPEITYGLNAGIDYKSFSLWANFGGASRIWHHFQIYANEQLNNLEDILSNRWVPGSMNSEYPRLPTVSTQTDPSGIPSTFWLKDATYLKLRSLEFSYQVPEMLLQKIGVSQMSIYLNGSNLLTFDRLKWADPEAIGSRNDSYPQNRVYNIGFNLSF